ncbi:MAG: helix-turn-helix domain-containing protein [Shimia sp.]
MAGAEGGGFGAHLRTWRGRRRTSQLDLALAAGVSARHVSFLETGRARPSRPMVLRLAAELDVPHEARNQWLDAAGLAPAYLCRAADAEEMRAAHAAVGWMVDRHNPYPGFALDRHWRIVRANRAALQLLGGFGIGEGDSLLDALLTSEALQAAVVNLGEVAAHTRARLAAQVRHYGDDPILLGALEALDSFAQSSGADPRAKPEPTGAFVPVRYRVGGIELSFFSALAQFHTAQDVGFAELAVELMFPADETTRLALAGAEDG